MCKTFVSLHTLKDDSVSLVSQNKQVVKAGEERHVEWTGVQVKTFAGEKGKPPRSETAFPQR